jgi:beta-xylosidase
MKSKNHTSNPVIRHKYSCDPTAVVYNETVYLYTGHDEAPVGTEAYVMNFWLCFSSKNMVNWKEHPVPLRAKDFSWSKGGAYATKVIQKQNMFYWFVAVTHGTIQGTAIGLGISEQPEGPFRDALGTPLVTHSMLPKTDHAKANLDPSVLIDDDGRAYMFWGNKNCYFAALTENLLALKSEIQILDLPGFEEGAHIHKRNGWYYLSYGYGMPEKVAYAMSRDINGPWEFRGILNEIAGNCETNRPCIVDYKGRSYFIYHNGALENGGSRRRSVCIDYLNYNDDNTIQRIVMTSESVSGV